MQGSAEAEALVARHCAMNKVNRALRELTANLLRITVARASRMRSCGKPTPFIEAMVDYRDAAGHFPSDELADALSAERGREFVERLSDEGLAVIRGALQIVASRVVGQLTQERGRRSRDVPLAEQDGRVEAERRKRFLAAAKPAKEPATRRKVGKRTSP
jgi:hypothetical protein